MAYREREAEVELARSIWRVSFFKYDGDFVCSRILIDVQKCRGLLIEV